MRLCLYFFSQGSWQLQENLFIINQVPLLVNKECTGIVMYALFLAFGLAFKAPWKKKLIYLGEGLLLLIALNFLRLFTLIVAAFFGSSFFNLLHDLLWPSTFFIFIILAGLFYMKRCSK